MIRRIRKIKYINHPRLGNLELNFCDKRNKSIDTIIIAGENGTCKSTILDSLYKLCCGKIDYETDVEVEDECGLVHSLEYRNKHQDTGDWIYCKDLSIPNRRDLLVVGSEYKKIFKMSAIYSDVDINFKGSNITSVTSATIDSMNGSRRSDNGLADSIKHLIIDVQTQDNEELAYRHREAVEKGEDANKIVYEERMERFKRAFNNMFDSLKYDRVKDINNHKEIYFKKNGTDIAIDDLSSGEKQIVYRGCFLLKDRDAMNSPFVFIDEPEISLHPTWQQKILDYYKDIYTSDSGILTSQIFVVTHSPFIIHNENRKNDKVIIIKRDTNSSIMVDDKSEYYKCNNVETIKEAFNINIFQENQKNLQTIYLEGKTDELYFKKTTEVYAMDDFPFEFKWIGCVDKKGNAYNGGKESLNKAFQFLAAQNYEYKNICLYDCDANKKFEENNNVISKSIQYYDNSENIKKGIENALVLKGIDINKYRNSKKELDDYGGEKVSTELDKMALCEYICSLDNGILKGIFINLKKEIDEILKLL